MSIHPLKGALCCLFQHFSTSSSPPLSFSIFSCPLLFFPPVYAVFFSILILPISCNARFNHTSSTGAPAWTFQSSDICSRHMQGENWKSHTFDVYSLVQIYMISASRSFICFNGGYITRQRKIQRLTVHISEINTFSSMVSNLHLRFFLPKVKRPKTSRQNQRRHDVHSAGFHV